MNKFLNWIVDKPMDWLEEHCYYCAVVVAAIFLIFAMYIIYLDYFFKWIYNTSQEIVEALSDEYGGRV